MLGRTSARERRKSERGNPNSLSYGWVGVVHEDHTGMVWAAPWYGGLNKLDLEVGISTNILEKQNCGIHVHELKVDVTTPKTFQLSDL